LLFPRYTKPQTENRVEKNDSERHFKGHDFSMYVWCGYITFVVLTMYTVKPFTETPACVSIHYKRMHYFTANS